MPEYKIIDAHRDTVGLFCEDNSTYDFLSRNDKHHIDLPRLKESGVKLIDHFVHVADVAGIDPPLIVGKEHLDAFTAGVDEVLSCKAAI